MTCIIFFAGIYYDKIYIYGFVVSQINVYIQNIT